MWKRRDNRTYSPIFTYSWKALKGLFLPPSHLSCKTTFIQCSKRENLWFISCDFIFFLTRSSPPSYHFQFASSIMSWKFFHQNIFHSFFLSLPVQENFYPIISSIFFFFLSCFSFSTSKRNWNMSMHVRLLSSSARSQEFFSTSNDREGARDCIFMVLNFPLFFFYIFFGKYKPFSFLLLSPPPYLSNFFSFFPIGNRE